MVSELSISKFWTSIIIFQTTCLYSFIPATLLNVLEKWLGIYTYVSWNSAYSHMFKLTSGVRQGRVLSPYLFAAYIDDLNNHVHSKQIGCMYNFVNACIVMYSMLTTYCC